MKRVALILFSILAAGPPIWAAPIDDALSAYRAGHFERALNIARPLAEQGDARAQAALGSMYASGHGVTKDDVEAVKWYQKAAEQGNADAQFNLGVAYHNGYGVTKDAVEAVKWYRKAAEQGEADAQGNLGVAYHNGQGITEDNAEAVKWYQKAADQGNAVAQYDLGLMSLRGDGVAQNFITAYQWFILSAAQGMDLAHEKMYDLRQQMTSEQIAEAQKLASQVKTPTNDEGTAALASQEGKSQDDALPLGKKGIYITIG